MRGGRWWFAVAGHGTGSFLRRSAPGLGEPLSVFWHWLRRHRDLSSIVWGQCIPPVRAAVTFTKHSLCQAPLVKAPRGSCPFHLTGRPSDLSKVTAACGKGHRAPEPRPRLPRCPAGPPSWRPAGVFAGAGGWPRPRLHSRLLCLQITGPWRSLWIRYGYDPRKSPEAKIYQVLDFRIRCGMKYGKMTKTVAFALCL